MDKTYFSVREAAAWSSLSVRFLYELCQNRKLRFFKVGRRIVIAKEDLEGLINSGAVPAVDWDEKARGFIG
jgi:excisionase family DNA binding protein